VVNTAAAGRVLDSRTDSKLRYASITRRLDLFVASSGQWVQLWGYVVSIYRSVEPKRLLFASHCANWGLVRSRECSIIMVIHWRFRSKLKPVYRNSFILESRPLHPPIFTCLVHWLKKIVVKYIYFILSNIVNIKYKAIIQNCSITFA